MKFSKSFQNAFRGIISSINSDRNFRIHTVVAVYVLYFSKFFCLSKSQYILLLLTISLVITVELLNTAIETLSTFCSKDFNSTIKTVKDISAGAVLCCAGFAVVEGSILFFNPSAFANIIHHFITKKLKLFLLIFLSLVSLLFIKFSPIELIQICKKALKYIKLR